MSFNADLLYQKYAGQSLGYDGIPADVGECVQWVEYVLTDPQYGYNLSPFWGNAIDWWDNFSGVLSASFNKITDGSIKKGDIVIFNEKVGSNFGHIDMAMGDGTIDQFTGADQNWAGNRTVHLVNHVGRQYVLGSLRLKGNTMSDLVNGDIDNLLKDFGITPIASDYGAVNLAPKQFAYWLQTRLKQCLVSGDVDNLLKDVGIVPTQADYDAVKAGPKPFAYYLQKRLKALIVPQTINKDSVIKYIQEKLT